jgi:hypothetical protein
MYIQLQMKGWTGELTANGRRLIAFLCAAVSQFLRFEILG